MPVRLTRRLFPRANAASRSDSSGLRICMQTHPPCSTLCSSAEARVTTSSHLHNHAGWSEYTSNGWQELSLYLVQSIQEWPQCGLAYHRHPTAGTARTGCAFCDQRHEKEGTVADDLTCSSLLFLLISVIMCDAWSLCRAHSGLGHVCSQRTSWADYR